MSRLDVADRFGRLVQWVGAADRRRDVAGLAQLLQGDHVRLVDLRDEGDEALLDGSGRRPAGWEDDATVLDRALAAIVSIAAQLDGGDALAVSHGGVIRVVERHLGADPQPIPNLSGRWLAVSDGAVMLGERVELLDPDDVEVTIPGQI